jgi:uncharacterized protein YciI
MIHYMVHLIPPRPTFAMDMDEKERALMGQHVIYWRERMEKGSIVVYGPVMDAEGAYGMGVVRFASEAELKAFLDGDPSVVAGINRVEYSPMRAVYPGSDAVR